jgi:hypothetical protein
VPPHLVPPRLALRAPAVGPKEEEEEGEKEDFEFFSPATVGECVALCDWASKHTLQIDSGGAFLSCCFLILGTTLLAFLPRTPERAEQMAYFWRRVSQLAQRCPSILTFFPLSAAAGAAIVRATTSKGLVVSAHSRRIFFLMCTLCTSLDSFLILYYLKVTCSP